MITSASKNIQDILTGKTDRHLVEWAPNQKIHRDAQVSFKELVAAAAKEGFELTPVSSYRSFEDQLRIWNAKATGQKPVLDKNSKPVDIMALEPLEIVHAILRWSALPGASRHHWGTDLDVIDQKAVLPGTSVQLLPSEFEAGGPFARLHDWLDENMESFGFFRPYEKDQGGIHPERWHISYFIISDDYLKQLDEGLLRKTLAGSTIALQEEVLSELSSLLKKYVFNIA